jgi:hypothetical protein
VPAVLHDFYFDRAWSLMKHETEIATLRHRSASGLVDQLWEFLPRAGFQVDRIFVLVRLGSAEPVGVEVPVSTARTAPDRIPGTWFLARRGESEWLLTTSRLPKDTDHMALPEAFHPDLPVGSILLTHAPEQTSRELEAV